MRFQYSAILASFLVMFSSCDITGVWVEDWQNNIDLSCLPFFFNISETSTPGTYNISYNYAYVNVSNTNCETANITGDFSSPLTQNSTTTGDWQDSLGQSLVYNASTETIIFTAYSGHLNLFSRNGSYISQIQGYGFISGVWMNPTPENSSQNQYCCAPSNLTIIGMSLPNSPSPAATLISLYDSNACPGPNPTNNISSLTIKTPSLISPIWSDSGMQDSFYFAYNTSVGQNKLVMSYNSENGTVCNYYFEKYGTNLNGTWYYDWQNGEAESTILPNSFQIQTVDNLYMTITYQFLNSNTENVIFELSPNIYWDTFSANYYTYYPDTNSFLNKATSKLYSLNGSILNGSEYVGVWGNVQFPTGSSASSCCVPQYINITNETSSYSLYSLKVTYNFGNSFSSSLCPGLSAGELVEDSYSDYIQPYNPNPYLIQWNDFIGFEIAFPNTSTSSEILVSFPESSSQNCSFTMTRGYVPKSALWLSNRVEILFVIVSFIFIFN